MISDPITKKSPIAPNVFTECHSSPSESGPSQLIFLACTEENLNPCQQSQPTMHHQTCMFKQFSSAKRMHNITTRSPMSSLYIIASLSKCNMSSNFYYKILGKTSKQFKFPHKSPPKLCFLHEKKNYQSRNYLIYEKYISIN